MVDGRGEGCVYTQVSVLLDEGTCGDGCGVMSLLEWHFVGDHRKIHSCLIQPRDGIGQKVILVDLTRFL